MNSVVSYNLIEQPRRQLWETPFRFTYKVDAMIPVKVEEPSPWVVFQSMSSQALREKGNLANEAKDIAHI